MCIEPDSLEVHTVRIQDAALSRALGQKVIVHLSDLHIRTIGLREKRVLAILEELQPDIILLTGDYVDWNGNYESAVDFLSRLKASIGIWAVMGDYDYSSSRQSCLFCHEPGSAEPTKRHTVVFLKDQYEEISIGGISLGLVGVDGKEESSPQTPPFLKGIGESLIVLSHSPLLFDRLPDDRNLVMVSGDTHGGQVPLPGWLFGLLGYEKNARYNEGVFVQGRKKLFVSRGIGTSHLPVRLFRKPEIAVLKFVEGRHE